MAGLGTEPRYGVYVSVLLVAYWYGWSLKYAAPVPKKNTPRTPPITPSGVSIASISGKRSSALKKNTLCPVNWRYSYPRNSEFPPK